MLVANKKTGNFLKLKVSNIVALGLVFGFVFNAVIQYAFSSARLFLIIVFVVGSVLLFNYHYKKKMYHRGYLFIFFICLMSLVTLNFTNVDKILAFSGLYVNISIILGFFAFLSYEKFKKLLSYMIVLSFLVMLYDIYMGEYLFNLDPVGNYYQVVRGKGLFSYSKEAGSFLIFASMIFRQNRAIMVVLLLSSVMSGSRSAMIFVSLVFFIDLFFYMKENVSLSKIFSTFSLFAICGFATYFYFTEYIDMWFRVLDSFDFSSSSHSERFYFWNEYLNIINDSSFFHILFGNSIYAPLLVGNGAENAYLTVFTHSGLIIFLIMFTSILFFAFLSIINFRLFYPFILLLAVFQFGRQGLGWADGILLWACIYKIVYSQYFQQILSRAIKTKRIYYEKK